MPAQDLAGYVPYLMMVFLPGIGLGELFKVWRADSTLVERFGLGFCIGLAIDTIVVFIRTSGLDLLNQRAVGLDLATLYLIIAGGIVLLAVSLALRRRFLFYTAPVRMDLFVALIVIGLGGMMAAFFAKYPLFPEYQSPDFANHVAFSSGLVTGAVSSLPSGILYYGVEYQLAASLLFVGGNPLMTVRETMAVLVLLSPLVFFFVSSRFFSDRTAALFVAVIYAFSATLWFDSVFNSGLYANFFGIIASLFIVFCFVDVIDSPGPASWGVFLLALLMAYLSHYSTVTIFPALLLVSVMLLISNRGSWRRYLLPGFVPVLPILAFFAAYPGYANRVVSLAYGGGGQVLGSTYISGALGSIPVLQYTDLELYDDVAFVVLLLLAALYTYRSGVARKWLLFIPVFWFFSVLLTSPETIDAWRFAFTGIVPLTMMAGLGIVYLFPKAIGLSRSRRGYTASKSARYGTVLVAVVFIGLLVAGSWGTSMLSDSLSNAQFNSQTQGEVYQAMQWLGNHTPPGSTYLSVSDWRFVYTGVLIGRTSVYQFESTPAAAIPVALSDNASYIIVTNAVTASLPPDPSLFPWNNFAPSSNLTMVYSNADVRVYQIANSSLLG